MKVHTKIYFEYFGIDYDLATGWHDHIDCELDGKVTVDIHHIEPKGMGGSRNKDVIDNLIALCRDCHTDAHAEKISKETLQRAHAKKMLAKHAKRTK